MTQTLNVEYQELMARADEIEAPLPPLPMNNPAGPCALSFIRDAAAQIGMSADSMRLYIEACQREWRALAKSLRNAAKAYEEVDEEAADALNSVDVSGSGSRVRSVAGGEDGQMMLNCDPDDIPPPPPPRPPPPPFVYPYYAVRDAARDVQSGDQGTAFRGFAGDWDAFQRAFQSTTYRFRPFTSWEGDARTSVEQNFDQQRQWIYGMVQQCTTLSKQAGTVADAHKKCAPSGGGYEPYGQGDEHPSMYEVQQCDYWYKYYTVNRSPYLYMALDWYTSLQKRSETALFNYVRDAGLPLAPMNPKTPIPAYGILPPNPDNGGGGGDGDNPYVPDIPDGGSGIPTTPTTPTMPTMPTMPSTGMPSTGMPDAAAMGDAMKGALKDSGLAKGMGAGMKPASLGGGGGAGAGMPSVPLQPASDGEASSRPASAGPGGATAGVGRGMPGAGGAMGGGGGMPMGAGGGQGQQNAGKGKRVQSDEESLYTEERAWTEGVIGNRPRKGAPEK